MRLNFLRATAIALATTMTVATFAQKPQMIYSTESAKWVDGKKSVKMVADTEADITVFTDKTLQTIDGIGGTFNELGWDALQSLPKAEQDKVMANLFSAKGCNFAIARIPIGASDYALSYYSCADVPNDFVMRDFNIDRDRYNLIPYVKAGMAYRPDLKVWASPWCPPAWMKINEHYSTRGGDWNGRENGNRMMEGADLFDNVTGFNMQVRYLQAYALYFSKFAQAYEKEGVPIVAIQPQNEIAYSPNWPSCTWRAEDLALFIGKYMGPQFEKDGLKTEIWLGTVNSHNPQYCYTIVEDKEASKYVKGIGFQWGGERALPHVVKKHPNLKYMQTENKCGEQENDWTSVVRSWGTISNYLKHGCESYLYWNMVLDQTGMSAWGWPQNSMVVVNRETKEVTYTDEFYLFKHLGHFVQPGSVVLETSKGKNHLAFKLTDGRTLVMVYNAEEEAKTTTIKIGDKVISADLQPKSINSILL